VDVRAHGRWASCPASRDRFAGLTGPAIKDGSKGSRIDRATAAGAAADAASGLDWTGSQAPTATRTKSVAKATNSPTRSAVLAAIGSAKRRQTAIISLKT
jgi:hypothetical protein